MIRPATAADTPRLVEMATRFLRSTPYGEVVEPDPACLAALIAVVLEHGVIFVADYPMYTRVIDGDVVEQGDPYLVGFIGLAALPHPLSGELYADEQVWWVEPEHRHGLIGPRLMQAAEAWARQQGCRSVKMVAPHGSSVGEYYSRMGYRPVETAFVKFLTE